MQFDFSFLGCAAESASDVRRGILGRSNTVLAEESLHLAKPQQLNATPLCDRAFLLRYLSDERRHLERLKSMADDPTSAAPFICAIPELLWQERYTSALNILRIVESWPQTGLPSSALSESLFERVQAAIAQGDLLPVLCERIRTGSSEVREQGIDVLAMLGVRGISALIELFAGSEDLELRRGLKRAVACRGPHTLSAVRVLLTRPDLSARGMRALLAALAQSKTLEASNTVRRFLDHPNPSVREEALAALVRIMGRHVEPELLAALSDPATRVRRHALECLRSLANTSPHIADILCELVRKRRDEDPEEDDQIQIRVCQLMVELCRNAPMLAPRFEPVLIDALDLEKREEFLGRWVGTRRKSDAVRGAMYTALGEIGGAMAGARLGRMLEEESLLVRDRIARAFRQLEERLAIEVA